jgi:hypothetical protein
VFASGFPHPSTGHDWYKGLTSSTGVACCGSQECRPVAARYNERSGSWETEVTTRALPGVLPAQRARPCRQERPPWCRRFIATAFAQDHSDAAKS